MVLVDQMDEEIQEDMQSVRVVYALATTGQATKVLKELAQQRDDFLLLDRSTPADWCPLAYRVPLLCDKSAAVEGVVKGMERFL